MSYSKIKDIKTRLWDKYDASIITNEDVIIIVGINGSCKTTLLNENYKLALENPVFPDLAIKKSFSLRSIVRCF